MRIRCLAGDPNERDQVNDFFVNEYDVVFLANKIIGYLSGSLIRRFLQAIRILKSERRRNYWASHLLQIKKNFKESKIPLRQNLLRFLVLQKVFEKKSHASFSMIIKPAIYYLSTYLENKENLIQCSYQQWYSSNKYVINWSFIE